MFRNIFVLRNCLVIWYWVKRVWSSMAKYAAARELLDWLQRTMVSWFYHLADAYLLMFNAQSNFLMFWPDEHNIHKRLQRAHHYKMLTVFSAFAFTLQFSKLKRGHLRSKLPTNYCLHNVFINLCSMRVQM